MGRDCGMLNGVKKDLAQREILTMEPYKKSCPQPGSVMGVLYNIIRNCDDYKQGILDEMEGGGDNCSRSLIDGCILGAYHGEDAIPKQWIAKTAVLQRDEINKMIKESVGQTVFGLFP